MSEMSELPEELNLIILLLKAIERDSSAQKINDVYLANHPLVNSVTYLSNYFLTGDDRLKNMEYIRKKGFNIFPGDQDRFGWLTGCIQLKNGIIIFG